MNTKHTFQRDHESDDCLDCGQPYNHPAHVTLVSIPATYTGGTITLSGQPVLVQGLAVRVRHIAASGEVTISYDPTDPRTPGLFYGVGTLIKGVRLTDLQRTYEGATK